MVMDARLNLRVRLEIVKPLPSTTAVTPNSSNGMNPSFFLDLELIPNQDTHSKIHSA